MSADDRALTVETLTLDEFSTTHPKPNFFKMDIEGAEVLALQGAQQLLAKHAPLIWLIECHSEALEQEVIATFKANGYTVEPIKPRFTSKRVADRHVLAWKK